MRKLEIADSDIMRIAIQQEIARSDESRYDHRLHGLLLLTGGQSCQQVADSLVKIGAPYSVGSSDLRSTDWKGCAMVNAREGRLAWMPSSGLLWNATCVAARVRHAQTETPSGSALR